MKKIRNRVEIRALVMRTFCARSPAAGRRRFALRSYKLIHSAAEETLLENNTTYIGFTRATVWAGSCPLPRRISGRDNFFFRLQFIFFNIKKRTRRPRSRQTAA